MSEYAEFKDKNFKLLVLEKLIYHYKVIQPEFDIFRFSANQHFGQFHAAIAP
ncbi:DUF6892 domain-containing protein [Microbulbifer okhotskensis]|uniref:DUF6892 domain-containing protein n=1 Tax=Microbulbifer okhotskensis TaxID=2926617 RepID=UPI00359CAA0E